MSKDNISQYSQDADSNQDIAGIGIKGSDPVRNMDNALREIMSHLADMNAGTEPLDDTFCVADPADSTKKVRIDAGQVSSGQTRVLTAPDIDGTIWTDGNDGESSGLDADLLDGQEGAYYLDASNIDAGVMSDERLPPSITEHVVAIGNPHGLTKADIFLGNVEDTSDLDKLVSTATQAALTEKVNKSGDTMAGRLTVHGLNDSAQIRLEKTGLNAGIGYLGADDENVLRVFDDNGYQEHFKVTQEGYVLKPNQPSFEVRNCTSRTSAGRLLFGEIGHNIGNHYNQTSGVFTAPVSGRYLTLLFAGYQAAVNEHLGLAVLLDGSARYHSWTYPNAYQHDPSAVMGIIKMEVGQTISAYANPSYGMPDSTASYCAFSVELLG